MYLTENLISEVFKMPYDEGYRNLQVLSGYVSPAFVDYILSNYEELVVDLTVGMVSHEGISKANHQAFRNLIAKYPKRLNISYQTKRPGNHRKVYYWLEDGFYNLPPKVFVGSANFSCNGFFYQQEVLVESTFENINEVFSDLNTMDCMDPLIDKNISITEVIPEISRKGVVKTVSSKSKQAGTIKDINGLRYIDVSLTSNGQVPTRSGLNWGQREGRNKNQAYLAISNEVYKEDPDFFPQQGILFLLTTDDGESIFCNMAQANRKGLHSKDNSTLGAYFRKRIGVASGAFVSVADLNRYGRDTVRIYKVDNETYYLDFSVAKSL